MLLNTKDSLESLKVNPLRPRRWSHLLKKNTSYILMGVSVNMKLYEDVLRALKKTGIEESILGVHEDTRGIYVSISELEGSGLDFQYKLRVMDMDFCAPWVMSTKTEKGTNRVLFTCDCTDCKTPIFERLTRILNGSRQSTLCRSCNRSGPRPKRKTKKVEVVNNSRLEIENANLMNALKYYARGNEDGGDMAREYFKGEIK